MGEIEVKRTTRVRKRSLDIQMELALRDAAAATTADISTQKLAQTRLAILNKLLNRKRTEKIAGLLVELSALKSENTRLSAELAQARAETQRTANRPESLEEKRDRVLAKLEGQQ